MAMLSGEIGGEIFASVDFGKESIEETTFVPIPNNALSAEELMKQVLYQKVESYDNLFIDSEQKYLLAGDPTYKLIPSSTGTWVRFENRYYNLTDLVLDNETFIQVDNSNTFERLEKVSLSGLTFTPVNNVEYIYTPPIPDMSRTDFPAPINAEHTAIIIYRLDNQNILKATEHQVQSKATFHSQRYDLYKLIQSPEYEPNKYYIERKVTSNFAEGTTQQYVLSTNKTRPLNDINVYYSLKPLYQLDKEITIKKLPLERIIREMVHAYALEPYHNIIVNDLDEYGLEQLTYKGEDTLYALRDPDTMDFVQLMFSDEHNNPWLINAIAAKENSLHRPFHYDDLAQELTNVTGDTITQTNQRKNPATNEMITLTKDYYVAKITKGMDIGYRVTDLTYSGDLITNIGDNITSVLDKIKDMLGEFEYFYDLDGHFVFQKKRSYVNTAWSVLTDNEDEDYVTFFNETYKKFSFNFEGNRLITAFQNSPNLNNLKNDYSVWGKRSSVGDKDVPIHARYAIDKKPKEYLAFNGTLYYTKEAIEDPSPEQADNIGNGVASIPSENDFHRIDIIPVVLRDGDTSDWWELSDWANYYYALTDAYPQQYLKDYGTEGFIGTLNFGSGVNTSFIGSGQLVIDFDKDSIDASGAPTLPLFQWRNSHGERGSWFPFQHRFNGCWHWYSQYLGFYDSYENMITYIYKPALPTPEIIQADGGHLKYRATNSVLVDWRELIYRMAIDYFAGQGCGDGTDPDKQPIYDFSGKLVINNPDHFLAAVAERNPYYYGTGYTGYEQYYTDMQGFWRQLYNPDYLPVPQYSDGEFVTQSIKKENSTFRKKQQVWNEPELVDFQIEYYVGGSGLNVEHPTKIDEQYSIVQNELDEDAQRHYNEYYINLLTASDEERKRLYWHKNVFEAPEQLNFWIEFLDDQNELAEYSIPMVGDRSKVVNEDKVGAIYYTDVPGLILCPTYELDAAKNGWKCNTSELRESITKEAGYKFIFLPKGYSRYFDISYRKISAKNKLDELLYQYAYCIENVTITALPVYHLQPNTRIYVRDDITRINGEYIVNKITLSLKPTGTMSISAVKAPERLY